MSFFYEISETIKLGLEGNAFWRGETQKRFPHDDRNAAAVGISTRLDGAVSEEWCEAYNSIMKELEEKNEDGTLSEDIIFAENEVFRSIGFGFNPQTPDEVAESLCNSLREVLRSSR